MKTLMPPLLLAVILGLLFGIPLTAHADPKHGRGHHGSERYWVPPGHRIDPRPRVVYLEPPRPRVVVVERSYRPVYAVPVAEPSINVVIPLNLR